VGCGARADGDTQRRKRRDEERAYESAHARTLQRLLKGLRRSAAPRAMDRGVSDACAAWVSAM
jgi:hypothetical protein